MAPVAPMLAKFKLHIERQQLIWISVGIFQFYGIMIPGMLFYQLWRSAYPNSGYDFMPLVTRHAADNWFLYAALSGIMAFSGALPTPSWSKFIGSCSFLIVWGWYFMIFYDAFLGSMCLHHGPEFEIDRCISLAYGIFPVTLVAVCLIFIANFPRRVG